MAEITIAQLHEESGALGSSYAGVFGGVCLTLRRDPAGDTDDRAYELAVESDNINQRNLVWAGLLLGMGGEPTKRKPPRLLRLYRKEGGYFVGRLAEARITGRAIDGGPWRLVAHPDNDERGATLLAALAALDPVYAFRKDDVGVVWRICLSPEEVMAAMGSPDPQTIRPESIIYIASGTNRWGLR